MEGRLVTARGVIEARPTKATSGDITFYVVSPSGQVRILADASSGLTPDSVTVGATYDVIGVAGQRASRKGALDGYRVWVRDAGDLVRRSMPAPSPSPSPHAEQGRRHRRRDRAAASFRSPTPFGAGTVR